MPYKDAGIKKQKLKEWFEKHPTKRREYQARWNKKNRSQVLEYRANWAFNSRVENYDQYRAYEVTKKLKKYGVDQAWYEQKLKDQNGVCAICKQPEIRKCNRTNTVHDLSVDHDHVTKQVRGLLCGACNTALHRNHGINWFVAAGNYLLSFQIQTF